MQASSQVADTRMKEKKRSKKKGAEGAKAVSPVSPSPNAPDVKDKAKSKKNTSLRLDKATLKALKIHAIENDTSVQKLIETLIHDYLRLNK